MDKKVLKALVLFLAGILIVALAWWLYECRCFHLKNFTPSEVGNYIRGFGKASAIIYISIYALNTVSVFPPIGVVSLASGFIFGKIWGAVYLLLGAMLGTSCTFLISRLFGRHLIQAMLKGKFSDFDERLRENGFIAVLFFRAIPLVPYEVLNYASGLSKIRFRDYFFATLIGLIPGVIISAYFGGSLGEIKMLKDLLSPKFIIALILLVLLLSVPLIAKKIGKRKI